jgi:chloramphenicol 3-O phosphotransferase
MAPDLYQPGIGLRPGGERPDLEPLVALLYRGLYGSIAVHSRLGLSVVADVGHHDGYSVPRAILFTCARELQGLPAWFVGVHCPLEVILQRRRDTWPESLRADGTVPPAVHRWQDAVHVPGIYDLEVDTSRLSPQECADEIYQHLQSGPPPTAFPRLAALEGPGSD